MKKSAWIVAMTVSLAACHNAPVAKTPNQMTLQNAVGRTVVCTPPASAPELTEYGRITAVVQWCTDACEERGYRWIGKRTEERHGIEDFDLGSQEREAVKKYIPPQCLPYEPGRRGIVVRSDGSLPECLGGVLTNGCSLGAVHPNVR